jgi:hypothetical protein
MQRNGICRAQTRNLSVVTYPEGAGVSQSVQCLITYWTTRPSEFDARQRQNDFSSSPCVHTGSGTHPASCTMGTVGPFPGAKVRLGRDADHLPPSSAEVKSMSRSYTFSPPKRLHGVCWGRFSFLSSSDFSVSPTGEST